MSRVVYTVYKVRDSIPPMRVEETLYERHSETGQMDGIEVIVVPRQGEYIKYRTNVWRVISVTHELDDHAQAAGWSIYVVQEA